MTGFADSRKESHDAMQAGLALLDAGRAEEALAHFERAADIRESWPWRENVEMAWMLAASWINRADSLRAAGRDGWQQEALRSLDRGIEVMGAVPVAEFPQLSDRLVLAMIKRADALAEAGFPAESLEAYRTAADSLVRHGRDGTPEGLRLVAMLSGNQAHLENAVGNISAAVASARRAVAASRKLEEAGIKDSAGVKTRSVLAMALATSLEQPGGAEVSPDWIGEATDAVEEALTLAAELGLHRHFTRNLLRCGARIYRTCQPHFLGEFVTAHTPENDAELRQEMLRELWRARADAEKRVLAAPHDDELVARQSRILATLEEPLATFSALPDLGKAGPAT